MQADEFRLVLNPQIYFAGSTFHFFLVELFSYFWSFGSVFLSLCSERNLHDMQALIILK